MMVDNRVEDLQSLDSPDFKRQPSTKPFVDEHSMTGKDLEGQLANYAIK